MLPAHLTRIGYEYAQGERRDNLLKKGEKYEHESHNVANLVHYNHIGKKSSSLGLIE